MNFPDPSLRFKILALALATGLLAVLGLMELYADRDLSFLVFYLAPLFLVIWFIGLRAGFWFLGAISLVWIMDDIALGPSYRHPSVPYWNLGAKLVFFAILALLLWKLRIALRREETMARNDPLTETSNARQFNELAQMEIHRSRRYRHSFTLAFMDVDNFKRVNDEFGHSIGDSLLKVIGKTLQKSIRNTDTIARVGGDEFALLLPETGAEGARFALKRLHKNLNEAMEKNGWSVTVSLGAVTFLNAPPTVDAALYRADQLMYRAKQAGKNQMKHETWEESSQRKSL